jgi:CheY-like chemotaxis protein
MPANESKPANAQTVLIAEDEAMLRVVAAETLRDAGYEVLEAGDGNEGLSIVRSNEEIDILISDIKMPGLNGYQLAEEALRLRPHLRVLLMTGYTQEPLPKAISAAGIKVLYKPFHIDQLAALTNGLSRPSSR